MAAAGAVSSTTAADLAPIRVAVIGTGARGSDLLRALTTIPSCEVAAICDDYPPHLNRAATYAGAEAKTYGDYRKLLQETKPQAVVIAVPLYLHYKIADHAIDSCCEVFC